MGRDSPTRPTNLWWTWTRFPAPDSPSNPRPSFWRHREGLSHCPGGGIGSQRPLVAGTEGEAARLPQGGGDALDRGPVRLCSRAVRRGPSGRNHQEGFLGVGVGCSEWAGGWTGLGSSSEPGSWAGRLRRGEQDSCRPETLAKALLRCVPGPRAPLGASAPAALRAWGPLIRVFNCRAQSTL